MKKAIFFFVVSFNVMLANAQSVGIGTASPNNSAMLEIQSSGKGLLIPRMTQAQRNAINTPATGLLLFQTDNSAGYYFNSGTPAAPAWQSLAGNGWSLSGNSNTNAANHFIGTTNNQPLQFRVNNIRAGIIDNSSNIFWGQNAGLSNTGYSNIAIGTNALRTNGRNTNLVAIGDSAMYNTYGEDGFFDQGRNNTAVGSKAMYNNTRGESNTAVGYKAMYGSVTGSRNICIGTETFEIATEANANVAIGWWAMRDATTAYANVGVGYMALSSAGAGTSNVGVGFQALGSTLANDNIGIGTSAAVANENGYGNIGIGTGTLFITSNSSYNTVVGNRSLKNYDMGYNNTVLGANCEVNAAGYFNIIAIGQDVTVTGVSQARIGNAATGSIGGYVNWTNISDGRIKRNIKNDVPGLLFISKLKPVTYTLDLDAAYAITRDAATKENKATRYRNEQDSIAIVAKEKIVYSGFIAQEVEKVAKDIGYTFSGVDAAQNNKDLYGLRYAEFVVPLVKAVQELEQIVKDQQQQINELRKTTSMQR